MRGHDYELTEAQFTTIYETLPKIADLALMYLVSGYPVDSYFDAWAGMMIGAGDTASWGDDAIGCALVDVGEKYEKFVKSIRGVVSIGAEIRGALLRAGSLLVSANNMLIEEKDVAQAITVGVEKFLEAQAKLAAEGITVPE